MALKIEVDFGHHAIFELCINTGVTTLVAGFAIRNVHLAARRKLGRDFDAKFGFQRFPELTVPLHLKSAEQNSWVPMRHSLESLELPKEASNVTTSNVIMEMHGLDFFGTQQLFRL